MEATWVRKRENKLRPWVRKIVRFLGSRAIATSHSRVDHFLILSEGGSWLPRQIVDRKLADLSEFVGFEVHGSDYIVDVAARMRGL